MKNLTFFIKKKNFVEGKNKYALKVCGAEFAWAPVKVKGIFLSIQKR
jgi:hypothetical protein